MNFLDCWGRIKERTDLKKLIDLANFIGISQAAISQRKKENVFPADWAFKVASEYNLSTDWILTGSFPKRTDKDKEKVTDQEIIADISEWFNEIVSKSPRNEDWFIVSFYKAFPEFEMWQEKQSENQDNIFSQKKDIA